ncbi:MAG: type I phosphomannose isomerase catalytic subunit [bacterium]
MSNLLQPLLFTPVYKDYIWGGQRIAARYGRAGTPAVCAESWEISAHADGPSRVARGPLAGQSLAELAGRFGAGLTGTQVPHPGRFPLLFKLIDARENLSVQVHPNDENAGRVGGEAKTEAWYVVDRTPGAMLYTGLKPETTPASFRAAMEQGTAPQQLFKLTVEPGDTLFIPGGLVHAIGAGCLIYEVQQTSNTTYRLFDWGRLDASGQPRPLHLQQAFEVIDPSLPEPRMIRTPAPATSSRNHWNTVLSCRYFNLCRLDLRGAEQVTLDGTSFYALFVLEGEAAVSAGGADVAMPAGNSCLIPAAAGAFHLCPAGASATVLVTTLNGGQSARRL